MMVILVSSVVFEHNKPNPAFEPTLSARLNLTFSLRRTRYVSSIMCGKATNGCSVASALSSTVQLSAINCKIILSGTSTRELSSQATTLERQAAAEPSNHPFHSTAATLGFRINMQGLDVAEAGDRRVVINASQKDNRSIVQ